MMMQPGSPGTPLKAGAARVDITPPLGLGVAGYRQTRRARAVHDPLYAKALVLDDGLAQLALVALDLICVSRETVGQARALIEARSGIRPECVMCWATHTHTGPVTDPHIPAGEPDPDYMARLPERIAESVVTAQGRLREARVGVGSEPVTDLAFNRRAARRGRPLPPGTNELLALLREGAAPAEPPIELDDWLRRAAVVDPDVGVIRVNDDASIVDIPIATVVNFALHCDTLGGDAISAGYPHYLDEEFHKGARADAVMLFAPGACGDVNHICRGRDGPQKGHGEARRIGKEIDYAVFDAIPDMSVRSRVRLSGVRRELVLARRPVTAEEVQAARDVMRTVAPDADRRDRFYAEEVLALAEAPNEIRTEVQAVAIGPVAVVALPGEIFVELGLEIKRRSPLETTLVVELANDYVGYVPTREAYGEGGYEVMPALTSRLTADAPDAMVQVALEALTKLPQEDTP